TARPCGRAAAGGPAGSGWLLPLPRHPRRSAPAAGPTPRGRGCLPARRRHGANRGRAGVPQPGWPRLALNLGLSRRPFPADQAGKVYRLVGILTGMPRPRGPARDQLLEAAQHLLLERGYEATALDEVCATTQVTKGGLFYHFESKEQLAA